MYAAVSGSSGLGVGSGVGVGAGGVVSVGGVVSELSPSVSSGSGVICALSFVLGVCALSQA